MGKLIGLLVEEKKDIGTVDVTKYQTSSTEAPKKDAPKETPKATSSQQPKQEV